MQAGKSPMNDAKLSSYRNPFVRHADQSSTADIVAHRILAHQRDANSGPGVPLDGSDRPQFHGDFCVRKLRLKDRPSRRTRPKREVWRRVSFKGGRRDEYQVLNHPALTICRGLRAETLTYNR